MSDAVTDPTNLYRIRDGAYASDLIIAAVAEFDLFTWLADHGPSPADELGDRMSWARRPGDVLLTLAASHGLVRRGLDDGDRITVTDLAREHLVAGSPYDLRAYYGSLQERPAVGEFARVPRTDSPAAWASAPSQPLADSAWADRLSEVGFAQRITAAMDARGAHLGPALARATSDLTVGRLLDVGGSSGVYAAALLAERPRASAAVFERAPIDDAARTLLRARGLAHRIDVVTGDMFADPLPPGFDVHLFSQVLHDWDAERVERLFAASYAALPSGGLLLDHDAHVDADKRGPRPVAEYSALLMHSTPGKCWSAAELRAMAQGTGFSDVELRPTTGDRSVFIARKP